MGNFEGDICGHREKGVTERQFLMYVSSMFACINFKIVYAIVEDIACLTLFFPIFICMYVDMYDHTSTSYLLPT